MSMAMPAGQVTPTGIGGQPSQADLQAAALARINAQTGNQNPTGIVHNPLQPPVLPTAEPMHGGNPADFGGGMAPMLLPPPPPGLSLPGPVHNPGEFNGPPPNFMQGGNPPVAPPFMQGGNPPMGTPPAGGYPPVLPPQLMQMIAAAAQRKLGQ